MQTVSSQLRNPITVINENFSAVHSASLFGIDLSRSIGLTFAYFGGIIYTGTTGDDFTLIADGDVALPASEPDVFVEGDAFGNVSVNTLGFTPGEVPLYRLSTNASGITSVVDYRIMFSQYSEGGAGPGSYPNLYQLPDVEINTDLANGDVLTWNAGLGIWENAPSAGGASDLTQLTDVEISTALADGDVLAYNSGLALWVNMPNVLDNLVDVSIPVTPTAGDVLTWDGGSSIWVAQAPAAGGVTNPMTALLDTAGYEVAAGDIGGNDYTRILFNQGNASYSGFAPGGEYVHTTITVGVDSATWLADTQVSTGEQGTMSLLVSSTSLTHNMILQNGANTEYVRALDQVTPGSSNSAGIEVMSNGLFSVAESYSASDASGTADASFSVNDATNTRAASHTISTQDGTGQAIQALSVSDVANSASLTLTSTTGLALFFSGGQVFSIDGLADAAGAAAGTLANAPTAGDPSFWMPITIGGTVYAFPLWLV